MDTKPVYALSTRRGPSRSLEELWDRQESLPNVETKAVEWFGYLRAAGHELRRPYEDDFSTWRGEWYLQLRSSFWIHLQQPLWALSFCSFAAPPHEYCNQGWLVNFLELMYRAMPHDTLIVEDLFEFFPELIRPTEYWPGAGGWSMRARPQILTREDFKASQLQPLNDYQLYARAGGLLRLGG
jgi:hypothetical protein